VKEAAVLLDRLTKFAGTHVNKFFMIYGSAEFAICRKLITEKIKLKPTPATAIVWINFLGKYFIPKSPFRITPISGKTGIK